MRLAQLSTIASVVFVLPYALVAANAADSKSSEENDPLISGFGNFVSWFRSHGGTVDDRIIIGHEPGTNIRGMIATAPIPANTLLIHTPGSLVLKKQYKNRCLQIREIIIPELEAGIESKWHTYFEFDDSLGHNIPSQWDRSGRAMDELQGLPPSGETHRHINWYQDACKEGKEMSDLDWKALIMYLTRAADIGLVPMYDLMNHHNGRINTRLEVDDKRALSVIALTDIPAGEPIFLTYARGGTESSVDVFNGYGFVEDYPQLWEWNDEELMQLSRTNQNHAYGRYGMGNAHAYREDDLQFVPNTEHHEVLMISPTLAALLPTKALVYTLGNARRPMADWEKLIAAHHSNLRISHANALADSAERTLAGLPTTIEEDELIIREEKSRLKKAANLSTVDVDDADAIRAIEYRLAFKKALRLITKVVERETFLNDSDEL